MSASCSKCPAGYARPVVAVIHSGRSVVPRDVAIYVGAHLALGGYAQVEVAPYDRDDELAAAEVTVVPHGAARGRDAPSVSLAAIDCRVQRRVDDAAAAVDRAAMIFACVPAEDAKKCGKWLAEKLARRKRAETLPVVFLNLPGGAAHVDFDTCFSEDARPPPMGGRDRDLAGSTICVAGAVGFLASRRTTDGALAALSSHGKLCLERLDTEREHELSKFYDLLSTCRGFQIEYVARGNLTTATWGSVLVYGPLLAIASLENDEDDDYRESLCSSRARRLVAAAALREARFALRASAMKMKARRDASSDARKPQMLWHPALDVAQAFATPRLLEWSLSLPDAIFRSFVAKFVLSAPHHVEIPQDVDYLAQLKDACDRAQLPSTNIDALASAIVKKRTKGAASVADSDLPSPQQATEPVLAVLSSLLIALLAVLVLLFLELLFPNTGAARSFFTAS